jgi:hypothetical protein
MKPVKAGTIPANMKYLSHNIRILIDDFQFGFNGTYMRRFFHLETTIPTPMKMVTETT